MLTVENAPAGSTLQWTKNNSIIPNETRSTLNVTSEGSYGLIVTTNNTPKTIDAVEVKEKPNPTANFTFSPSSQCSNQPVFFSNTSTGTGLKYEWDFGDPNSSSLNLSTSKSPSHSFVGTPGNSTNKFTVKLISTNEDGCTDTKSAEVITKQLPDTKLNGSGSTIYNNKPYFVQCNATPTVFSFSNNSSTKATNAFYEIQWGDGTPNFTSNSFTAALNHTYNVGNHTLLYIVTGQNGCKDTGVYNVFVGSNPAVGFGTRGNTVICTGTPLTFDITGIANNPPGTIYTVTFSDGSPAKTFTHPAPPEVTHIFDKGSCGMPNGSFPNSFSVTIEASNPCGRSAASVSPIYVSEKGKAAITISPKDSVCVNSNIRVTNSGTSGSTVSGLGVCSGGKSVWQITPSTGWTINSGELGDDFGSTDPNLWSAGTNALDLRFSRPGIYTIKLINGGNALCGSESITKTICVNPQPIASFTINENEGCGPVRVKTTNTSPAPNCGDNSYLWSVSYSTPAGCAPNTSNYKFINGTSAVSIDPEFEFTNPGIYTISLITKAPGGQCQSTAVTKTVTVKEKPRVSLNIPSSICQNGSFTPAASIANCNSNTTTYSWTFLGGTPGSANTLNPGPITYNTAGGHNITLTVTNECGSTTVSQAINVTKAPDVVVPANQTLCTGTPTAGFSFSSSVSGTSFTWTNNNTAIGLPASGNGNIPSFTATNNTNTPITATITVTPKNGCTGPSGSFTITVNPKPTPPQVTSALTYCLNAPATALEAIPAGENTLTWYNNANLNNGSPSAPVPPTNVAGTFNYYVTQGSGNGCKSTAAVITVTVLPAIANNLIGNNQSLCTGGTAAAITQVSGNITGGNNNYTYQWEIQKEGTNTWEPINGATSAFFSPGAMTASAKFRRIVNSGTCATSVSNEITINVQGSITGASISGPQTICAGTRPLILEGQAASSGNATVTYQWESSNDLLNWQQVVSGNNKDYHPPILTNTTHYRRKTMSGACSVLSAAVTITVNPSPVISQVSDKILCNDATASGITFSSTPGNNITYKWVNDNPDIGLAASGSGNISGFTAKNANSVKVPITANIKVSAIYENGGTACEGNAMNFKIVALPTITVKPIDDQTVCAGTDIPALKPEHDAGSYTGSSVSYSWVVTGGGTSLTNGTGEQIRAFSAINNTSSDQIATITVTPLFHFNNITCTGDATTYKIIVKPGTPKADAGQDIYLCAASQFTLNANLPTGTTGAWRFIGNTDATLSNPASASSTIGNMKPGQTYQLEWTLTGHASCPPTKDIVVITNYEMLANEIDLAPISICEGQPITVLGKPATGGNGSYQFQWQESIDGTNWNNIIGQTGKDLRFTPTRSVSVRRNASSGPCQLSSLEAKINVQPGVSNNTIASNQSICVNNAVLIKGSLPAGGDNQFSYSWEQSIDNGNTWAPILNAVGVDYQTPLLTQTTQFKRKVSTQLCSGPQQSSSNVVTITVNPNAKAFIAPVDTLGCPPFSITAAMLKHQPFMQQNKEYQWYIDGVLFSTSNSFPGYTMQEEDDTLTLKLKAISLHGCLNDSISYRFYTYPRSTPGFTLSETSGCGPLSVQINNTTPKANLYKFEWNFGNGITSIETQPGTVIFQPNPTYGDTTYYITMRMLSPCDTTVITKSVFVKSKPKVLFTPSKTVGCSPMRITFNNTSLGKGNQYTWDFGDGTIVQAATAETISHTFVTGVRDTFYVKLKAVNECGEDVLTYAVAVSPNQIFLDFALNGNEHSGCAPHTVRFINNSKGASSFRWDFGDGNILSTTNNIDTVTHTYLQQGNYTIQLRATNGCSDTATTEQIAVFTKPMSAFSTQTNTLCIGDIIQLTNASDSATSYLWIFGDGNTSTLVNPEYKYRLPGNYNITLKSYRTNRDGTVCTDSISQALRVVSSLPGWFDVTDSVSNCAPLTVTFHNRNLPSVTADWDFGDGFTGTGNTVTHTFTNAGTYIVKLTTLVPGGCTYITTREIKVLGPSGTVSYQGGYLCNDRSARFQANVTGTDSIRWDFGDGTSLVSTDNIVYHTYKQGGDYVPSFTLLNKGGCGIKIQGKDTIKVDKIKAGFTATMQPLCGSTTVTFTDTTHAYFGKADAVWNLGNGNTGSGYTISHKYNTSGSYPIQLIAKGLSGCSDTINRWVDIKVNDRPVVAIEGSAKGCTNTATLFRSKIQSIDSVSFVEWTLSNGAKSNSRNFTYNFNQTGTYTLRLIAGTVNGCFDTTLHTIYIDASPIVKASNDQVLCLGTSTQLSAVGASKLTWQPFEGLNCTECPSPIATPRTTTTYIVEGTNAVGCSAYDTVVITVIQPMNMVVSPNDSICIGQSANLLASGATTYSWSPATGLSSTTISNPVATPSITTTYRVVGYDGFNCFTDTAFVTVAVGQYPKINLGADLTLSTGTLHPLASSIENGPIKTWSWSPSTDLSCSDCPRPIAHIKKDITYWVEGTTAYGCSARDTVSIKVFCENSQLFIPNAFTPDGDGANDILMVRGKGIASVKTFRIFNRWGEVVFEKGNFMPNDPTHGWDGKVRGIVGAPDVYVYTAEVICENGTSYTYKGNVSIIK